MNKNVLITGANAGLGLETARQLARRSDYGRIFVSARSPNKADSAIAYLVEQTGVSADRFEPVLFDLLDTDSIQRAVQVLASRGVHLDEIVLNAGGMSTPVGGKLPLAPSGNTRLFDMNVGGHARLVNEMLDRGVLSSGDTVVFAGSEAARGVVLPQGEQSGLLARVVRGEHTTGSIDPRYEYGLVKLIGTVWMTYLAQHRGLRALTVSPGASAGTNAGNVPFAMRVVFSVMMRIMKLFGRAHGVDTGAARYVRALGDGSLVAGAFYASPPSRWSGPLVAQTVEQQPLLGDEDFIAACGRLLGDSTEASRAPALS